MAYPHSNALADVTATFPGGVYVPTDVREEDLNGYDIEDELVDSSTWTNVGGRWRATLKQVPLEQITFTALDDTESEELGFIPWGETPGVDEIAVSMEHGHVEVHADRHTHDILLTYRGRGSSITSRLLNQMQREIEAIESFLTAAGSGVLVSGINAKTAGNTALWTATYDAAAIEVFVCVTSIDGSGSPPDIGVGIAGGAELAPAETMSSLTAAGKFYRFVLGPGGTVIPAPSVLELRIPTGSTYTTHVVKARAFVRPA